MEPNRQYSLKQSNHILCHYVTFWDDYHTEPSMYNSPMYCLGIGVIGGALEKNWVGTLTWFLKLRAAWLTASELAHC